MGSCNGKASNNSGDHALPPRIRNQLLRDYVLGTGDSQATLVPRLEGAHTGIQGVHIQACATLGNRDLRALVQLPRGVERNAWIAAKTVALFEEAVAAVTVSGDICSSKTCPRMSCGKHIIYDWADETSSKPEPLCAIEYMGRLVQWGHEMLKNDSVLPRDGKVWQPHFLDCMKALHRRLFRIYAHIYINHFEDVKHYDCEAILNFQFKHWLFFVRSFGLVVDADLLPLRRLVEVFETKQDEAEAATVARRRAEAEAARLIEAAI